MMYVPNVSLVSPETLVFAKCGINYWGVNDVFLIWFFLWMSQLKSSQMLCVTLEWSLLLHHLILHSDVLLVEVAVQVQEKGHGHFCVFKIHFLSDSRDGRAWQRPLANIWSNCRFRQITLFSPALPCPRLLPSCCGCWWHSPPPAPPSCGRGATWVHGSLASTATQAASRSPEADVEMAFLKANPALSHCFGCGGVMNAGLWVWSAQSPGCFFLPLFICLCVTNCTTPAQ